jgi:hypothetical protein
MRGVRVIDAYPVHPLARTPRMLARALAGHSIETVIARGTIALGDNGNAPIELRSDRYGSLRSSTLGRIDPPLLARMGPGLIARA